MARHCQHHVLHSLPGGVPQGLEVQDLAEIDRQQSYLWNCGCPVHTVHLQTDQHHIQQTVQLHDIQGQTGAPVKTVLPALYAIHIDIPLICCTDCCWISSVYMGLQGTGSTIYCLHRPHNCHNSADCVGNIQQHQTIRLFRWCCRRNHSQ